MGTAEGTDSAVMIGWCSACARSVRSAVPVFTSVFVREPLCPPSPRPTGRWRSWRHRRLSARGTRPRPHRSRQRRARRTHHAAGASSCAARTTPHVARIPYHPRSRRSHAEPGSGAPGARVVGQRLHQRSGTPPRATGAGRQTRRDAQRRTGAVHAAHAWRVAAALPLLRGAARHHRDDGAHRERRQQPHAPNENLRLRSLWDGIARMAELMTMLGAERPPRS
jgi:hypothetical protein